VTPRQIRAVRAAGRFMPRLWAFAYPMQGRGYERARRVALRAWAYAFRLRVRLVDV
jgi:hypothetical protein